MTLVNIDADQNTTELYLAGHHAAIKTWYRYWHAIGCLTWVHSILEYTQYSHTFTGLFIFMFQVKYSYYIEVTIVGLQLYLYAKLQRYQCNYCWSATGRARGCWLNIYVIELWFDLFMNSHKTYITKKSIKFIRQNV